MPKAKTSESKAVALFGDKNAVPAYLQTEAPKGNENVDGGDLALPRLDVLQGLSHAVSNGVEGAVPGRFMNSVTGEIVEEVYVVNLQFSKEWMVRETKQNGVFVGIFNDERSAKDALENQDTPSKFEIVEQARHTLLTLDPETGDPLSPAVMLMNKTRLSASRNWNTQIQVNGPKADRFASVWKLSTVKQSNQAGSWYNLAVDFVGWAPEALHAEAAKLQAQIVGSVQDRAAA